jgi:hypothetical protein
VLARESGMKGDVEFDDVIDSNLRCQYSLNAGKCQCTLRPFFVSDLMTMETFTAWMLAKSLSLAANKVGSERQDSHRLP